MKRVRFLSFLMTLVMVMGLFSGLSLTASAATFDGGTGTSDDPYLISTAEQLGYFRDLVNGGKNSICGQLTKNIDLHSADWMPIGIGSSGYNGTFDGSGYAIRNLLVNKISNGTHNGAHTLYGGGLFGIIGKSGVVRRVNVDGVVSTSYSGRDIDVGMIVGGNLGTIEECFATVRFVDFNISITSSSNAWTTIGGIAGVNDGTIKNCYVVGSIDVNIEFPGSSKRVCVGGLVGDTTVSGTTLQNCYSAVTINVTTNGTPYVGGLVGDLCAKGTYQNLYTNSNLCGTLVGRGSSYLGSGGALVSTSYMKSAEFADVLGNAFAFDTDNVNQGYPILSVMAYDEESDWSDWFEDETMGDETDQEIFNSLIPPELQNKDLTKPITRVEFCAVAVQLYEQMGGPKLDASTLVNPFTDTSADVVRKAYAIGITNGVSDVEFEPYTLISREQLATMLTRVYKALNLPGWTLAKDSEYSLDYSGVTYFDDDEYISAYAKPSVYFMVKNEVIKGMSATIFAPRNTTPYETAIGYANASREQALIMAVRMFKKL